jgi:hypothetical protein
MYDKAMTNDGGGGLCFRIFFVHFNKYQIISFLNRKKISKLCSNFTKISCRKLKSQIVYFFAYFRSINFFFNKISEQIINLNGHSLIA